MYASTIYLCFFGKIVYKNFTMKVGFECASLKFCKWSLWINFKTNILIFRSELNFVKEIKIYAIKFDALCNYYLRFIYILIQIITVIKNPLK